MLRAAHPMFYSSTPGSRLVKGQVQSFATFAKNSLGGYDSKAIFCFCFNITKFLR